MVYSSKLQSEFSIIEFLIVRTPTCSFKNSENNNYECFRKAYSRVVLKGRMYVGFLRLAILLKITEGLPQYMHCVEASLPLMMISPPQLEHVYT